jgi:capsular polysaccharide biosynthesis protein
MNEIIDQANEITLLDIYRIIKKNLIMIFSLTFLFGILASLYVFFLVDETYKSNAFVMVQIRNEGSSNNEFDLANAQKLLQTAADLIKMPVVLERVIINLELDLSVKELQDNLSVSSSSSSYFINVSYVSTDPALAKVIVNEVINEAIVFADAEIPILATNIIRTSFAQDGTYHEPNKILFAFIGLLLGGIAGVGIAFIKELMNNTFKYKDQLENVLGIQVLGVIPEFDIKESTSI